MIADDQTLRHTFVLANPWDRDVRILQASAHSPCCSTIDPTSTLIPRHSSLPIPVTFHPGFQAGKRRVDFLVATDAPDAERIALTLTADLTAAWEMTPLSGSPASLLTGRPGVMEMEVVCRRSENQGLPPPDGVESAGVEADLEDGPGDARDASGLSVARRKVRIRLPAHAEPGSHRAELAFTWAGGRRRVEPIHWIVRPWIRSTPSAVFLGASASREVDVRLEAEAAPFRVTGVSGATIVPTDGGAKAGGVVQTVRLAIAPAAAPAAGAVREITIATDHPRQPTVPLTVVITPRSEASR
ncbi:MAG: hypothetical protein BGO49_07615 [Planctomycetales bacterium 71-10]|nr:MAG: hypothetical protein BGO49_07615 [Planctomycetales bacterium 71-10]